jgi:hypothetical protein
MFKKKVDGRFLKKKPLATTPSDRGGGKFNVTIFP